MTNKITIERKHLLDILDHMRSEEMIPNTYQFTHAEETEIKERRLIRLYFEEWSYPYVMGREHSRMLPEQCYNYV